MLIISQGSLRSEDLVYVLVIQQLILCVYFFQPAELNKPVDKKVYKSTNPTCHDFNKVTVTGETVSLLIGFSTGQIQLVDPIKKDPSKLYNEEVRIFQYYEC